MSAVRTLIKQSVRIRKLLQANESMKAEMFALHTRFNAARSAADVCRKRMEETDCDLHEAAKLLTQAAESIENRYLVMNIYHFLDKYEKRERLHGTSRPYSAKYPR